MILVKSATSSTVKIMLATSLAPS